MTLSVLVDEMRGEAVFLKKGPTAYCTLPRVTVVMETHVHQEEGILKEQNVTVRAVKGLLCFQAKRLCTRTADGLCQSTAVTLTRHLMKGHIRFRPR